MSIYVTVDLAKTLYSVMQTFEMCTIIIQYTGYAEQMQNKFVCHTLAHEL